MHAWKVVPLEHGQTRRPGTLRRAVQEVEQVAERAHVQIMPAQMLPAPHPLVYAAAAGARRPPGATIRNQPMAHLVSEILSASLADLMGEARSLRRGRLVTY